MLRWLTANGLPGRPTFSSVRSSSSSAVPSGVDTVFSQLACWLRVRMAPKSVKTLAVASVS